MSLFYDIFSPFLNLLKNIVHGFEFRKFKNAVSRNPQDSYLRARFAKYCLKNYFQGSSSKIQIVEAVNQFENVVHSEVLDLEVFYLMGKFYQGNDNPKAMEIYRKGIKRYNDFVSKSVEFRHEYVETAFTMALNLLSLESNVADPELERFFKNIRRTYLKHFLEQKVEFAPEGLGDTGKLKPNVN